MLSVAVIQQNIKQDVKTNLQNLANKIKKASKKGAKLVVLQELHNSIYFPHIQSVDYFDLAESIPGRSTDFFGKLAKKLQIVLVISIFERRAKGLYHNSAVVIETDGTIAGVYRKMHIPDDPGFYEKFYFTEGDLGFEPIATSVGKLGVMVCWDQWYGESARIMALKGADVLIYPTAIGWDTNDSKEEQKRQLEAWQIIQRAHSVANAIPVIVANRVGFDEGVDINKTLFWGSSFICGFQGEVLAKASSNKEEIIYANLDLNKTDSVRRIWPFLRDRRVCAYNDILKRYVD